MHNQPSFLSDSFRFVILFVLIFVATVSTPTKAAELDSEQKKWHTQYKKQQNAPIPAQMLLNTDPEPDLIEGFVPLFNGKDLTGWTSKGGLCTFEAKDNMIVGTCVPGANSTYLSTDKASFKNFVFSCDMKWEVDGNSGVMFRAKAKPGKGAAADDEARQVVYGPQVEMEGFEKGRGWSGGVYGQSCGGYFYPLWLKEHRAARAALKEGEWNRLTISAEGNVVKTWINGVPAAHWVDEAGYPQGFFGLQIHKGKQGTVLWKNIRVKELPE